MFECKRLLIEDNERTIVDISFRIRESLALVGESGSGKSLTLKALLGLLPSNLHCKLEYEWDTKIIRGKTISFVPQNPFTSLSPLTKIKYQFLPAIAQAKELLELVGLDGSFLERYPPQLSGGQVQRVVIAIALSLQPKLLLLDEPTTALDPDSKMLIIDLLKKLQRKLGFLMLFVTHDIQSAKELCKEISIIQKGRIVESGLTQEVLANPKNSYTKILIESNFATREFRQ